MALAYSESHAASLMDRSFDLDGQSFSTLGKKLFSTATGLLASRGGSFHTIQL